MKFQRLTEIYQLFSAKCSKERDFSRSMYYYELTQRVMDLQFKVLRRELAI